jgi:nucleotide-binding universal stress UspA family protein
MRHRPPDRGGCTTALISRGIPTGQPAGLGARLNVSTVIRVTPHGAHIMAMAWKAQLAESFAQAQAISGERWQTIRAILQETLPSIGHELAAGAKEIGGIGATVASVTTENLRTEGKVKTATLRQQWHQWRATLVAQGKIQATAQFANLKTQSRDWDVKLEARFGDRYKVARQVIGAIGAFYQATQTVPTAPTATGTGTTATIEVPFQVVEEPGA